MSDGVSYSRDMRIVVTDSFVHLTPRITGHERKDMQSEKTPMSAPVHAVVMRTCICPTVTIRANPGQVTEEQQIAIARELFAMVELITDERMGCGRTVFGKHRDDCACGR